VRIGRAWRRVGSPHSLATVLCSEHAVRRELLLSTCTTWQKGVGAQLLGGFGAYRLVAASAQCVVVRSGLESLLAYLTLCWREAGCVVLTPPLCLGGLAHLFSLGLSVLPIGSLIGSLLEVVTGAHPRNGCTFCLRSGMSYFVLVCRVPSTLVHWLVAGLRVGRVVHCAGDECGSS
jgi:hypothetical protein